MVSYRDILDLALLRLADTTSSLEVAQNRILYDDDDDDDDLENIQYKRGIYYHNHRQHQVAQALLDATGNVYHMELKASATFYVAEDYHQQYLYKGGQSTKKGAKEPIRCFG